MRARLKPARWFVLGFVCCAVMLLGLMACASNSQDIKDSQTVNDQQTIYAQAQPIHVYPFSFPRAILQQLYDVIVPKVVSTHSVIVSDYGQVLFDCPSRGYPIPGGTELTNPLQVTNGGTAPNTGAGNVAIGQPDPDGLYHPSTSEGTYVLCVRKNGDVAPVYAEPKVITFPFEVTVGTDGRIHEVDSSPSSAKIDLSGKASSSPYAPSPTPSP